MHRNGDYPTLLELMELVRRWAVHKQAAPAKLGEPTDGALFADVDERLDLSRGDYGYRTKYRSSPYLAPMIGSRARKATVMVTPREQVP